LACGGITNPSDVVGDGEADGDRAVVEEATVAVGRAAAFVDAAAAVPAVVAAAAALAEAAEAAEAAAFLADTAVMLAKSKDAARATPTINVMTGVGIFMPRGTQRGHPGVQRSRRT
jgi:hypothetical protein